MDDKKPWIKSSEEIYDSLIADVFRANDDEYFEFDGNDNCEDCLGWDGVSRRCHCGNRRVCWTMSECKTYVYAEAF